MSDLETSDIVRKRAYEIWESEGRPHGRHVDHWLQAEAELRPSEKNSAKRPRRTSGKRAGRKAL